MSEHKIVKGQEAKRRVKEANKRRREAVLGRPPVKHSRVPSILSLIQLRKK